MYLVLKNIKLIFLVFFYSFNMLMLEIKKNIYFNAFLNEKHLKKI